MPYKLHRLSIPYRIVQSSFGFVPLLLGIAFVANQAVDLAIPIIGLLLIAGIGGIVGWQVAYYRRFEYELTADTFDIRSGVISRRNREIPYRRVQNVDISRSLVQRALDVAELRIETAGGSSSEAHLRYVGYDEAKRLQEALRDREAGTGSTTAEADSPGDQGDVLYAISDRDLAVLAVASFDLRVASFLLVILSFAAPSVILDLVFALPVDPFAVAVALALAVVLGSAILSGGSAIVNNYDFRLSRVGDELRYERGLLQRYDGSIPLDKVQCLVIGENVLKRLAGYASLTVETAGYAPGQDGADSASAVPISERSRTIAIAERIEPAVTDDLSFTRPASQARMRYTMQYGILVAAVTLLAFGIHRLFEPVPYWWTIPGLAILAPVAAHLKWRNRGVAVGEEAIFTRSGFWRRRTHVIPFYRIQTVDESQTILQRRWRIATVVVDTAGSSGIVAGDPTAYDLDDATATDLRERLSSELQRSLGERHRFDDPGAGVHMGARGAW